MIHATLLPIHGFWSSNSTWDRLRRRFEADNDLEGLRIHRFSYESPRLSLPFTWTRIPDYNDIAQTLTSEIAAIGSPDDIAVVTHSQGGLILQRYLAWMLHEGRGRELARIRLVVMLACPNEGSEYLRSIRAVARFGRHPQARDLETLSADATDARRTVLMRVVNATDVDEHQCHIPIYLYAGSTDKIVDRASAQSVFPNVGSLPGNHFSILDTEKTGNITYPTLKMHILETLTHRGAGPATDNSDDTGGEKRAQGSSAPGTPASPRQDGSSKYRISIRDSFGIQIGDGNTQSNSFPRESTGND